MTFVVRVPLLIALILCAALAGCTQAPPEVEDDGPSLPLLAEYEGCPWTYPDNTSHECEPSTEILEPEPETPIGWICTAENRQLGWSLHWNPVDDVHGLRFELPENATGQTGVLFLRTDRQEHLYRWDDSPGTGFLRLPATFGENVTFRYGLHDFGYATNGTLRDAEASQVWSLFQDRFWVVHKFEAEEATYTFQNMTDRSVLLKDEEGGEREEPYYEIDPFHVAGEDFTLWVHHERTHSATSQGLVIDVRLIDRFCQTGLGS